MKMGPMKVAILLVCLAATSFAQGGQQDPDERDMNCLPNDRPTTQLSAAIRRIQAPLYTWTTAQIKQTLRNDKAVARYVDCIVNDPKTTTCNAAENAVRSVARDRRDNCAGCRRCEVARIRYILRHVHCFDNKGHDNVRRLKEALDPVDLFQVYLNNNINCQGLSRQVAQDPDEQGMQCRPEDQSTRQLSDVLRAIQAPLSTLTKDQIKATLKNDKAVKRYVDCIVNDPKTTTCNSVENAVRSIVRDRPYNCAGCRQCELARIRYILRHVHCFDDKSRYNNVQRLKNGLAPVDLFQVYLNNNINCQGLSRQ